MGSRPTSRRGLSQFQAAASRLLAIPSLESGPAATGCGGCAGDRHVIEDAPHPVPNPLLDPGRIQPREDPSQRVVRGDPVRQFQERAQSGSVEFAEEGDGHETAGSTDDRQHGQQQDVRQVVQLSPVDPRLPGLSKGSTRDGGIRPSLREFSAG